MTTEQWKPTVDEVRLAYIDRKDFEAQLNRSWADEGAARAEFDRFVAKIKADALREFGRQLIKDSDPETDQRVFDPWDVDSLATNRAYRIEAGEER